ncbi:hypothetical protein PV336_16170 [Streptomyces sp. MI02-2A]|uniref:hypothetical protein n=1 Tax=Streptomyces sp. MI02-2A TaxID=3028688 RepID=UPI0029A240F8|nr:hypothetical protein [Streptomyces sp. MI02-2A]MDX3260757.1 hypothetical protein [Streptomyces sp. MI02-2A]
MRSTLTYPNGPANHNGYQSAMYEARLFHDPYDQFGWVQEWRFALAEVLLFDLGEGTPGYNPGAATEPEEDSYAVECLRSAISTGTTVGDLRRMQRVLDRFREMLAAAGLDY